MAKINRRFIDKHWNIFLLRGALAAGFGCFSLFSGFSNFNNSIAAIGVLLLAMGVIDAVGAIYSSSKKHGWINSVIDCVIDLVAGLLLLMFAKDDITSTVLVFSVYTIVSGIIDIFHGFLSTSDPTDRFIRVLAGACGCVIGAAILNAGSLEITTFIRFFGAYMLMVGVTSLIYGVHNRAQNQEDKVARREARKGK